MTLSICIILIIWSFNKLLNIAMHMLGRNGDSCGHGEIKWRGLSKDIRFTYLTGMVTCDVVSVYSLAYESEETGYHCSKL